ncbi:MAG TPA: DUF2326 domain-containing protein [Herbaspirillum sp.]|uniref:DUF2326 domain-containing protein n=1 Tax=Herbaspirillum sp. TaxID=1890675 RepID=UPI002D416AF0|nr:DUF2326 domain-containing protein [Herbaspirillum sp.]HZG20430.1 DUF2326 domain-containing protein [Herbaspirillum sp.]
MLVELRCDLFRVPVIKFHSSLNVVAGDANAANSIGKSTLLMLIDFAFGGDSFLTNDGGAIGQLGHHHYEWQFDFAGKSHYFRRSTSTPNVVTQCSATYQALADMPIGTYLAFLKDHYLPAHEDVTFRAIVGVFSRIWGKDNITATKPLHSVQRQSAADCVNLLLKIFDKFSPLKALEYRWRTEKEKLNTLKRALKTELIPQITKTKYKENERRIENFGAEIKNIKENLALYALSIGEIANKRVMELKLQKDDLLEKKFVIDQKLERVKKNISENRHLSSKNLHSLEQFFPNQVDTDKIANIEEFHSKISQILKKELVASADQLASQSIAMSQEIEGISKEISSRITALNNPEQIVDRVYDLAKKWESAENENKFFKEQARLKTAAADAKDALAQQKDKALAEIQNAVNKKLAEIVREAYDSSRKSPVLSLTPDDYKLEVVQDTGTGKTYSNLIVFDLALFELTSLPVLIHDSVLFKNIENPTVANFIKIYLTNEKQSFISLDEISKYGESAQLIEKNKAIQLTNSALLYRLDWRDSKLNSAPE